MDSIEKAISINDLATEISEWNPFVSLNSSTQKNIYYSCGFLRCLAQQWLPGLSSHWLLLRHSLGIDLQISEIVPVIEAPLGDVNYFARLDQDQFIGIACDQKSAEIIQDAIVPNANKNLKPILSSYLARRLFASISQTWSGPQIASLKFDPNYDFSKEKLGGAIKLTGFINGSQFIIFILLSNTLVDLLDELWKKQIYSESLATASEATACLELAQLAVPVNKLTQYLTSGAVVDLEVPVSSQANLYFEDRALLRVKLLQINGNFAFETELGTPKSVHAVEGAIILSVRLAHFKIGSQKLLELSQPGACYELDVKLSNSVELLVRSECLAKATLHNHKGNFAIKIL